jgi:hypothetical protein
VKERRWKEKGERAYLDEQSLESGRFVSALAKKKKKAKRSSLENWQEPLDKVRYETYHGPLQKPVHLRSQRWAECQ